MTSHVSRIVRVASRLLPAVAAALLACSDSDGPTGTTAPVIAGLSVSPDVLAVDEGGGMGNVSYFVTVSDPDADVARVVATVVDAAQTAVSQATVAVENPPGATMGALNGAAAVPTTQVATYTIEIQAFDRDGRGSNVLRRSVSVVAGNPRPAIAALSPESAVSGGPSFTLTVSGSGFVQGSKVRWDGFNLPTTFVDGTTLRAMVDSSRLYYVGSAQITVDSPGPGGGTSAAATFVVEPQPPTPLPTLASISPERVPAGSGGFTLTVVGTGFVPSSSVRWNGYGSLATTYVDATTLRAYVDGSRTYSAGSVQITVLNPAPGGGTSTAATLVVEPPPPNPVPTLTAMSPESVVAGRDAFTLTVTGSGFVAYSRIHWNGGYVSTTFVDSTTLTGTIDSWSISSPRTAAVTVSNPTPGGGTSSPLTFTVTRPEQAGVTVVALKGNDLAWDPYQRKIYVSVPSGSAVNPNTVTVLDPSTGELGASQFVGSEPDRLALTEDGQRLYVALRGASSVERLTVPELAPDLSISMGRDPSYGAYFANDLRVAPGSAGTLAVSLATVASSSAGGIVVYDDATPRPTKVGGGTGSWYRYESLQWGATASDLYASSGAYDDALFTFSVDASGIALRTTYGDAFSASNMGIHLDAGTGLLYADDGRVIDPDTGLLAGTYPASGYYARRMLPDSALGSAFFVGGDGYSSAHTTLAVHDLLHYYAQRSTTLSFVGSPARRLTRWGVDGLAFLTPESVVLVRGPFVLPASTTDNPAPTLASVSPSTATAGSANLVLTVAGAGFVRGSTVLWNGSERATTYASPTRLVAYVPASDLASAGSAEVTVSSPSPGGGTSAAAAFTVSP